MSKRRKIIISVIIAIAVILAFAAYYFYSKNKTTVHNPKVLVIYKSGTTEYLDIFQNFKQSYILNTEVSSTDQNKLAVTDINRYDVVYPDISLITSSNINDIKSILTNYVSNGGNLFLESGWEKVFPKDFTGIKQSQIYNNSSFNLNYPKVNYNLEQLQTTLKDIIEPFITYRKDDLKQFSCYTLDNAKSLVNINGFSIMSVNKYNNGFVLSCSSLIPNKEFITGFDFISKNSNQQYFDYSFATINYLIRNEFLAFSQKEKHGFTLKKIFGPYNRPAMAWQNHYEGLGSIRDKEMISWIDVLKEYNQIPSFSLVRAAYDWGDWKCDITLHSNVGTNSSPIFIGETDNSYYSSGDRLRGGEDYLTFGTYPQYKSLNDPIDLPYRAYPTAVDYDNDSDTDLIVGAPDGKIYIVLNTGTKVAPKYTYKQELNITLTGYSAPFVYDINKDGLFDIIAGDKEGYVNVYINSGSKVSPIFSKTYKLTSNNLPIKVDGYSAPALGDINKDGTVDLIIGNTNGLIVYKGTNNDFLYSYTINSNLDKYTAPNLYDYNNDGFVDLLVGDNSGKIKLFINNNGTFIYKDTIKGQTNNQYGDKDIIGGHNSVPLVYDYDNDRDLDLLVGQLEFGISYDITDQFFKYKNQLKEIIKYANDFGIPVNAHFFTHKYRTAEQELKELELHKKAFVYYNIPWKNIGANQHTWRISNNVPQTLISEMQSDIFYNFGFNPPNQPDLPRDGKEFLFSMPFLLSNNENVNNFLTFAPSPNLFMYSKVYNSFSGLDMPISYFEHIEYRFSDNKKLNELKEMAWFLNNIRSKGEYNFVTEGQMAKSFITALFSKAKVTMNSSEVTIIQDTKEIPGLAEEYKDCLGVKFEKGEKYKDTPVSTSSPIHYSKDNDLYIGLTGKTNVMLNRIDDSSFYIVKANIPIKIYSLFGLKIVKPQSKGMQEIKIYSENTLKIKGRNLKVQNEGNYYTITHYGDPVLIKIKSS